MKGKSAPTVFHNPDIDLHDIVHGDDFTFLGWEEDLIDIENKVRGWSDLKVRGVLSGGPDDKKEISILNRRLTWDGNLMTYVADIRHSELSCEAFGLSDDLNGLTKPVMKETIMEIVNT